MVRFQRPPPDGHCDGSVPRCYPRRGCEALRTDRISPVQHPLCVIRATSCNGIDYQHVDGPVAFKSRSPHCSRHGTGRECPPATTWPTSGDGSASRRSRAR